MCTLSRLLTPDCAAWEGLRQLLRRVFGREYWDFNKLSRQYYFDGGYHRGYRARLDKVVGEISGQWKPDRVPGRIYPGLGLEDLDALRHGQLVLLCLFVKRAGYRQRD
jgi:hypothetical protein